MNTMQIAIIKKDLRGLVLNKRLFPPLLIVPFVFTVVLPSVFILMTHFAPDEMKEMQMLLDLLPFQAQGGNMQLQFISLLINHLIPVFFMIIPIMAASIMAASSFAGEKEKRTLETLLYCPLTIRNIFQAKVVASFLLSMLVSCGSFVVMLLVVEIETLLLTGSLIHLNINWSVTMLLVSPAVSMLAVTLIVRGSAKAQTMDEAQQRAAFMVLPVMMLVIGQVTGLFLINVWMLLGLGLVLAFFAGVLMRSSLRKLDYEALMR